MAFINPIALVRTSRTVFSRQMNSLNGKLMRFFLFKCRQSFPSCSDDILTRPAGLHLPPHMKCMQELGNIKKKPKQYLKWQYVILYNTSDTTKYKEEHSPLHISRIEDIVVVANI